MTGAADDAVVSDSITSQTRCRLSPPDNPAHEANAPSGRFRPHDVPNTHRTSQPDDSAASRASRATRLLPTPAGPQITAPDVFGWESASSMIRISPDRPTNGHVNRIDAA